MELMNDTRNALPQDWRKALHAWLQTLREDLEAAVHQLPELLKAFPHVRPELLERLGDQVRTDVLRKLFDAYPDLLPGDAATFEWLVEHSPRLLEVWLERYTLTPAQAWRLIEAVPRRVVSRRLLERAFEALPEAFRELYGKLSAPARKRLVLWRDVLFEQPVSAEWASVLAEWLEGRPVWNPAALEELKRILDLREDLRDVLLGTLPDLVRRTLQPAEPIKVRQDEVLWFLHRPDEPVPPEWQAWIVESLSRLGNPVLWAWAREHPQLRTAVAGVSPRYRGWLSLEWVLRCLNEPTGRVHQRKLQALLGELGVSLRSGRRQRLVSAEELGRVLDVVPLPRFIHRLHHFKHVEEISRDPAVLRRLVEEKLLRRTVVPHIYESLVEDRDLRATLQRWTQEYRTARQERRRRLQELIQRNLVPVPPQPFQPDPFQVEAVEAFRRGLDVLVTAPTGSGKTWIAEQAMAEVLRQGGRAFYATPLRALSYQKLRAFREKFGWEQVGVLTGEYRENATAPLIVGTTEIVRNLLLDGARFQLLVLDEAHYIGDVERGSAWEESILLAPRETRLILLSATIPNAEEIAAWLRSLDRSVFISTRPDRPVPLEFLTWMEEGPELGLHPRGRHPGLRELLQTLKQWSMTPALIFVGRRDDAMVMAYEAAHILPPKDERAEGLPPHPLAHLLRRGIGVHHAGLGYAFRETVESLMERGELDFIFCTSSLAHGIDAPVRTTVLYDVSPFWDRSELQHALGRAGRRGYDQVGFAVVALPAANIRQVIHALRLGPQPLESAFAPHDAAVAALVAQYGIDGTLALARKSLRLFQGDGHVQGQIVQAIRRLVRLGFMERDGTLTDMGRSIVRLMHPHATAVVLTLQTVSSIGPEEAAIIAAFFSNERPPRRVRHYLDHPLVPVMTEAARMAELTEIDPRDGARRAWIIRQWLRGREVELREMVGVDAEGDIERLRIQVVELLRKMEGLDLSAATQALFVLDPHFMAEHPDWPAATVRET
jgi:hypothetical protein